MAHTIFGKPDKDLEKTIAMLWGQQPHVIKAKREMEEYWRRISGDDTAQTEPQLNEHD